jgi:hypothetical protein
VLLGIDHLVIAVPDPDVAVAQLGEALHIEPGGGGRHDRLGTFNRLLWLGNTFIELIGVFDHQLAIDSWIGAPTVRALDLGGGLATWAVATDDIEAAVRSRRDAPAAVSEPRSGERRRPDGRVVRWWLATPPELGPTEPPFLIEHDANAAEWTPSDRASRAEMPGRLEVLELPVPDAAAVASRFSRVLGIEWERGSSSTSLEAWIGDHVVRLRNDSVGRPEIQVRIDGMTRSTFELLGCRWVIVD